MTVSRVGACNCTTGSVSQSLVLQTYLLHWFFDEEMRALVQISSFSFLLGFLGYTVTFILDKLLMYTAPGGLPSYRLANTLLQTTLRVISPHYLAMRTLAQLALVQEGQSPWAWATSGQSLSWLTAQAGIACTLLLLVTSNALDLAWWHISRCAYFC